MAIHWGGRGPFHLSRLASAAIYVFYYLLTESGDFLVQEDDGLLILN